jgi:AraC-like DNA-binding protein
MDALSDVLRLVGLSGGVFLDAEFTEPWSVAGQLAPVLCRPFMAQPEHVICFHYLLEGACRVEAEGGPSCDLATGDVVVLPGNDAHIFRSARARTPVSIADLLQLPNRELGVARIQHGGGGARTRMVCGFLGGNEQLHPLLANLPPVMTLRLKSLPSGEWMAQTFAYAARTMADGDPGAATVLAKMSELMFVEAVRLHLSLLPPEHTGWLAGLRDPAVGRALALMHTQLDREWTSESLAQAVNLSRSMFAERFTRLIGVPPMRYLLNWRVQVAMQQLRETRQSVAQIAFGVGYESEAAFTRAFRRELGLPPAAWRRQSTAGAPRGGASVREGPAVA